MTGHRTTSAQHHNPIDSDCIFWTGDRQGVDLRAVCLPCAFEGEQSYEAWRDADEHGGRTVAAITAVLVGIVLAGLAIVGFSHIEGILR